MTAGQEEGYRAALEGLAVAERGNRARLRVTGRSPGAMLIGIVTNRLPAPATPVEPGVWTGRGWYSAILTPKGRMITDLRIFPDDSPEAPGALLLDLPAAGLAGTLEHFGRFLPPRLARAEGVEGAGFLSVMGPGAPDWLVREVFGLRAEGATLEALEEDAFLRMGEGPEGILVVRSGELAAPTWDVLAPGAVTSALLRRAREEGVSVAEPAVVETLRVEAGRPAYGVELDDGVIPTEAGLEARAVDHTKGCYTGQEVIVRIRDRGHVNRHLRGLIFPGDIALPVGTPLVKEPGGREMGKVASVVHSPRAGRAIGLGWVRREVEVPGEVLAGEEGVVVGVRALPEASKEGPVAAVGVSWAL